MPLRARCRLYRPQRPSRCSHAFNRVVSELSVAAYKLSGQRPGLVPLILTHHLQRSVGRHCFEPFEPLLQLGDLLAQRGQLVSCCLTSAPSVFQIAVTSGFCASCMSRLMVCWPYPFGSTSRRLMQFSRPRPEGRHETTRVHQTYWGSGGILAAGCARQSLMRSAVLAYS